LRARGKILSSLHQPSVIRYELEDPAMIRKLFRLAIALLPVCLLSAQQPNSQSPLAQTANSRNVVQLQQPSPEAMRKIGEEWQRMREHADAINDLAGNIQSPDDARKLVNLVADEFSKDLPPRWMTHGIRERIARAEYAAAAEGALIPDERVAAVWNDFVERIGAPQETMLNAAEIHYVRDGEHLNARLSWNYGGKDIWSVPGVFALGPDGRVANGSRALEAIRLLWNLGNGTADFAAIHTDTQKGILPTDRFLQWQKQAIQPAQKEQNPGGEQRSVGITSFSMPSFPIREAAFHYTQEHGERSFEHVVEGLLKDLLQ
jgi:hypothetical protein